MLDKSFNPKEAEARLYKAWEDGGYFQPDMSREDSFSIVIPPPNVTGNLHMGHAVNNTIQDILARYNRMKGRAVLWQPGTDHAGIATQMVVERKLAAEQRQRKDMSREEFIAKVWEWKEESGGNIVNQLKRLGSSCDWSRVKFTLGDPDDSQMADAITKAFVDMYNDGLIYRDKRLVNWDPHFQTAISDLEVENVEVDGHFWHFKYPLEGGETYTYVEKDEDGNITLTEERDYISIATTRPETMLGDGAVAVHPDDERYAPIVGKMVRLPLANRLIPIITDEYPDPEFGSGAVKITGAHDFNDYEVAKRNNISMYPLMGTKGEMIASEIMPEKYVGMDRFVARKEVVKDIDAEGLLIKVEDKKVMQPFGDRSKVVIEPMLTDQWFVDAEKMAGEAIEAVARGHQTASPLPVGEGARRAGEGRKKSNTNAEIPMPNSPHPSLRDTFSPREKDEATGSTRFIPENWKKTYDHWMKDIQPWCISRQLWWGHRIPAYYGYDDSVYVVGPQFHTVDRQKLPSGPIFCAKDDMTACDMADSYYGAIGVVCSSEQEAWELLNKEWEEVGQNSKHSSKDIKTSKVFLWQDPDVLDTWFSSGLWPFSTLGWPEDTEYLKKFYPTSVLVTAFDIIFFWVARMMMQGLHFMGEVPFKDVYIHALVLDEAGKKMSKSVGNTLDPLDLIDGVSIDDLVVKRTRGLKNPDKAPQVEKATRKAYPDGFEAYGADALRFTLASQAGQGRNIRLSVERIAGYRNFGTKLWNATRFGEMNGAQSNPDFDPKACTLGVNQWMIAEAHKTASLVGELIDAYRFNDAADAIYKFAWGTFCDWYIELVKPLLSGDNAAEAAETRGAFSYGFDMILKLLHPFMPFISEELWANTGKRDELLIIALWPNAELDMDWQAANEDINWLIDLVSSIRSVRAEMNIPPGKKAPLMLVGNDGQAMERLGQFESMLAKLARVDGWSVVDAAPKGALQTVVDGASFAIPMEGLVDLDAERARLDKEMKKLEGEIAGIDKKLSNPNFVDKAPQKVVDLQKDRRAAFVDELEKLQAAKANLG